MWRRVSKHAAAEVAKEVAKYIALWAIPPGVGVMGWLEGLPWFYVTVGVILSGAGIMTWLVQLDEWRNRKRVENKLIFRSMRIHLTQHADKVIAVRFGFDLLNTATFPIKFKMDDLKTNLKIQEVGEPLYPPKREYQTNVIETAPGALGWFYDHDIVLPKGFQGAAIAELHGKLSYGKAERFDYHLVLKKSTVVIFDGSSISGGQNWNDQ